MKSLFVTFLFVSLLTFGFGQSSEIEKLNGVQLIDTLKNNNFSRQLLKLRNVIYADTLLENLVLRKPDTINVPHGNSVYCPFRPLIVVDKIQIIYWNNIYDKKNLVLLASSIQDQIIEAIDFYDPLESASIYGIPGCNGSILISTKEKKGIDKFNGSVIN